jgi:hypothetical protein
MIDNGKKITFYFLLSEMPLTKVKIKKPGKNPQKQKHQIRKVFWL